MVAMREAGIELILEGEAKYKAGLESIARATKQVDSETRLAMAGLGEAPNATKKYRVEMAGLQRQMGNNADRVRDLTKRQSELRQKDIDLGKSTSELNDRLLVQRQTVDELNTSYNKLTNHEKYRTEAGRELNAQRKEAIATEKEMSKTYQAASDARNKIIQEQKEIPTHINNARAAQLENINAQQRLNKEWKRAGGVLAPFAERLDTAGATMYNVGDRMTELGGQLTAGVTLPILAVGGGAVKAAMDWETAWVGVEKTNDGTVEQMETLQQGLRDLTAEIPLTHTEVARIAEVAGQLGIELGEGGQNVIDFTKVIAEMGVATDLATEDAATNMARLANITQMPQTEFRKLGSTIVELGNNVAANESEILNMSTRLARYGQQVGMTEHEIVGMSAAMASVGVRAEEGGSAMGRVLQKMNTAVLSGTDEMYMMAEVAGMTGEAFSDLWQSSSADATQVFVEGLRNIQESGGDAAQALKDLGINSTNEISTLLALAGAGDLLAESMGMAKQAWDSGTALGDEAALAFDTFGNKVELLKNRLTEMGIELGGPIIDAILSAIDAMEPWIQKAEEAITAFSEMDPEMQRNKLMWVAIAAAAGPALGILGNVFQILGTGAQGFSVLSKWLGRGITQLGEWVGILPKAAKGLNDVTTNAGIAGKASALFSNPWALAIGGVVAGVIGAGVIIRREAEAPHIAHQQAVEATDGAYQDWFNSVVEGSGLIADMNATGVTGAEELAQAYTKVRDEIMQTNRAIQDAMNEQFEGAPGLQSPEIEIGYKTDPNAIQPDLGGVHNAMGEIGVGAVQTVSYRLEDLQKKLVEGGHLSQQALDALQQDYVAAGTILGNAMDQVSSAFTSNHTVTEDWASGQITAVKNVATETMTRLEEVKQARIEDANSRREQGLITEQEYTNRVRMIEESTEAEIQAVNESQARINAILADASKNNRALRQDEVMTIMADLMTIADATGESFSEIDSAAKILGDNLSGYVSAWGLEMLEASGLIDDATLDMIANGTDMEAKTQQVLDLLEQYGLITPEAKKFLVDATQAEEALLTIDELANAWADLTFEERLAQVETRGKEEVEELLEKLGVDWESLTPTQKEYYAQAVGGEALENILYLTGEWNMQTDPKKKFAILETQIDNEALLSAIKTMDLWNNAEFMSLAMEIDTNAPDAEAQIVNLVNYFAEQQGLPPLQMETEALTDESAQKLAELISMYTGAPVDEVLTFLTETNAGQTAEEVAEYTKEVVEAPEHKVAGFSTETNAGETAGEVSEYSDAVHEVPERKSSELTSSVIGMIANTIATLGYNAAVDNMTEEKSSTISTATPMIASRTALGWDWIGMLNSAYNKTSTLTTIRRNVTENVVRSVGGRAFATGGHIDAFANGGDIQWAGMFAGGGSIPEGYQGIVGEAGPELFTVTNKGVSITPLSPNEKMRGVGGAIEDEVAKQLGGKSGGDTYQISIHNPVVRDDQDINSLSKEIMKAVSKDLAKQAHNKRKGRPVW